MANQVEGERGEVRLIPFDDSLFERLMGRRICETCIWDLNDDGVDVVVHPDPECPHWQLAERFSEGITEEEARAAARPSWEVQQSEQGAIGARQRGRDKLRAAFDKEEEGQ